MNTCHVPDIVLGAEDIKSEWDGPFPQDAYRCYYKDVLKQHDFKSSEKCMFRIHGSLEEGVPNLKGHVGIWDGWCLGRLPGGDRMK